MKKLYFIIIAIAFIGVNFQSNACTNFLVTKGASTDGSIFISYAADSQYTPHRGSPLDLLAWASYGYAESVSQSLEYRGIASK